MSQPSNTSKGQYNLRNRSPASASPAPPRSPAISNPQNIASQNFVNEGALQRTGNTASREGHGRKRGDSFGSFASHVATASENIDKWVAAIQDWRIDRRQKKKKNKRAANTTRQNANISGAEPMSKFSPNSSERPKPSFAERIKKDFHNFLAGLESAPGEDTDAILEQYKVYHQKEKAAKAKAKAHAGETSGDGLAPPVNPFLSESSSSPSPPRPTILQYDNTLPGKLQSVSKGKGYVVDQHRHPSVHLVQKNRDTKWSDFMNPAPTPTLFGVKEQSPGPNQGRQTAPLTAVNRNLPLCRLCQSSVVGTMGRDLCDKCMAIAFFPTAQIPSTFEISNTTTGISEDAEDSSDDSTISNLSLPPPKPPVKDSPRFVPKYPTPVSTRRKSGSEQPSLSSDMPNKLTGFAFGPSQKLPSPSAIRSPTETAESSVPSPSRLTWEKDFKAWQEYIRIPIDKSKLPSSPSSTSFPLLPSIQKAETRALQSIEAEKQRKTAMIKQRNEQLLQRVYAERRQEREELDLELAAKRKQEEEELQRQIDQERRDFPPRSSSRPRRDGSVRRGAISVEPQERQLPNPPPIPTRDGPGSVRRKRVAEEAVERSGRRRGDGSGSRNYRRSSFYGFWDDVLAERKQKRGPSGEF